MTDPLADLLRTLDLQPEGTVGISVEGRDDVIASGSADADVFVGRSQPVPWGRVYGGQVLGQCVVAAGRTVDAERPIHSLHGYFLRPGDSTKPIRFAVERLRDGRSFSARRVHALQDGRPILSMIASFQVPAGGMDHAEPMPDVPAPETLSSDAELLAGIDHPVTNYWRLNRPIELRHVEQPLYTGPDPQPRARQAVWMRFGTALPDDALVQSAALAYISDYTLLEPVLRRHGVAWGDQRLTSASLDHAMWWHRRVPLDGWLLYVQESPSASSGRGLGQGRIYTQDGTLVASVAQEGMLRLRA